MAAQAFRTPTEDEIAAAREVASFAGWPADEGDLAELVGIVLNMAGSETKCPPGVADDPYHFLYAVR
ncbi:hypothetical protein NRB_00430 [Novosphingobium sp. 11B]|jgi:hypothetical protein|uniref:hypothetical protein n=1 Tax=Novosphingobium sp. fls2-241-R2A-195 TaxID=3040296 RepID=UPI00254EF93B|nr:hypothetical protein [Novosphingobium sp. fls2-241-R2A-195]